MPAPVSTTSFFRFVAILLLFLWGITGIFASPNPPYKDSSGQ
jgi:hypothetical protein